MKVEFVIYRGDGAPDANGDEQEFTCSGHVYEGSSGDLSEPPTEPTADGFEVWQHGRLLTDLRVAQAGITEDDLIEAALEAAAEWHRANYCEGCKSTSCRCP